MCLLHKHLAHTLAEACTGSAGSRAPDPGTAAGDVEGAGRGAHLEGEEGQSGRPCSDGGEKGKGPDVPRGGAVVKNCAGETAGPGATGSTGQEQHRFEQTLE